MQKSSLVLRTLVFILTLGPISTMPLHAQNTPDIEADTETSVPEESSRNPDEIRRGLRMGGENGKSRSRIAFERLVAPVEPDFIGKPERLEVYTRLFENEMVQDNRTFATNVEASWDADSETVTLEGYVNYSENLRTLQSLFENLGFANIQNEVEVLPSKDLGDLRYAIVSAPVTFAYDQPEKPREQVNQGVLGDQVFLLKKGADGYFLCATSEGYIGYIDGSDLSLMNGEDFAEYRSGTRVLFRRNFEPAETRDAADKDEKQFFIPAGARLKYGNENAEGKIRVVMPDGQSLMVDSDIVALKDDVPDAKLIAAVDVAKSILGTDYVWGGKTKEGVDCSGLVYSAFAAQGVNLARDAYQQAYNGSMVATRWNRDGMRLGDLMYFLGGNGRITHTAIYIGDGIFIESSGEVQITSLNPGDENYSERRDKGFAFAKRVIE